MGYAAAVSMAGAFAESGQPLEDVLEWHLGHNHYPPIPPFMVPVAMEAIRAVEDDDGGRAIELPSGITYSGGTWAPAFALVEVMHLEPFIRTVEGF
jgi:hypothetical protein